MARTITTGQRNQIAAGSFAHYLILEVTDPDGNWRDVSTGINGVDWAQSFTVGENIDNNTMTFSATLLRERVSPTALSLAPLMTGSLVNRNAASSYAPMIDLVRMWRAKLAVVAKGATPISTDYKPLGSGYIDTVDTGGISPYMTITGRDLGAKLLDTYISVKRPYGGVSGQAMETVIQNMLDDNLGAGVVTLYTPTSPLFVIQPFTQQFGSLMEAINTVAQQAGMVVRYRYDASDVLRLTLYKPNRAASVADWILGPGEYLDIPQTTIDISGVRNRVELNFIDATTGNLQTVYSPTSLPTTSTLLYGVRHMALDLAATTQITNSTAAQAMADAVRSDTEFPALQQQFETFGAWFVQLGDYGRFSANGVQYDNDQYGGVTAIQHTFQNGVCRTRIDVRGQPAGRYKTWLSLGGAGGSGALAVTPTPGPTSYSIAWSGDGVTLSIDGGAFTTPTPSPIVVARSAVGGADHTYTFRGIRNGEVVQTSVPIPAIGSTGFVPSTILTPSLTTNQNDDTVNPVTITAKATNLPASYVYSIYPGYAHGYYSSTPSFSGSNSSNPLSGGGFTFNIAPSLKADQWFKIVVTAGGEQYSDEVEVQARMTFVDPAGLLMTGTSYDATIAGLAADQLAAQSGRFLGENFDQPIAHMSSQYAITNAATLTYQVNASNVGRDVLQCVGYDRRYGTTLVPFNPSKLYRYRVRFRQTVDSSPAGNTRFYFGLQCFDRTGAVIPTAYAFAYCAVSGLSSVVADGWREITAWIQGATVLASGLVTPSTDARTPSPLYIGTAFVSIGWLVNYNAGNGTAQIDYIQVDEFDEDAFERTYTAVAVNGAIYRANPFDDAGTAARAVNPSGFQLHGSVIDSRSALLNAMFRTSVDTMDNVLDGATYERTLGTYLDTGRLIQLYRVSGGNVMTSDTLGDAIGVTPGNLVKNGSGQTGTLGADAPNWTQTLGNHLVTSATAPKIGDRCLAISHPSGTRSYASQTISLKANAAYKVEGWLKYVGTETATTDGIYIQLSVPGTNVVTDSSAQWLAAANSATGFAIGTSFNPGNDGAWRYVTATIKTGGGGAATFYTVFGTGVARTGVAYFDGLTITEQPKNVTAGGYQGSLGLDGTGALIGGLNGDQDSSGAIYFLDTDGPSVGTVASPFYKLKTIRIPYTSMIIDPFSTDYVGQGSTAGYVIAGPLALFAQAASTFTGPLGAQVNATGCFALPIGAEVRAIRIRVNKNQSADFSGCIIYNVVGETVNTVTSLTLSVSGGVWTTLTWTGSIVITNNTIQIKWGGNANPTIGGQAMVAWFELDYRMYNFYQTI